MPPLLEALSILIELLLVCYVPVRLREEDVVGVEEVRYLIDKMLSRTPDRLIRLTQVYSQVFLLFVSIFVIYK
jgi:hypothetical protein